MVESRLVLWCLVDFVSEANHAKSVSLIINFIDPFLSSYSLFQIVLPHRLPVVMHESFEAAQLVFVSVRRRLD